MFKKKIKCSRCGKKIDKEFDYCPYCGNSFKPGKAREQQFKDFEKEFDKAVKMPFVMKFPLKQLMRQFEKQIDTQMREIDKNLEKGTKDGKARGVPKISGLSISISSDGEGKPMIRVGQLGKPQRIMTPEERAEETAEKLTEDKMGKMKGKGKEMKTPKMTKAKAKKFSKLPKAEPETKVRRLTDRVVYEIALPGVKSVKDIIVNKLDNSIEIKAFSKDKAYFKLIPIALPIKRYALDKETLILELIP